MENIINKLSYVLPICAASLIIFILLINIYLKLRKLFPARVNCWFCNTWTKVPYENRNSFDCPNCNQYNGFKPDGNYNKVIEAQHNCSLNTKIHPTFSEKATNGLCNSCNTNQQLKITQLARFSPMREENYDAEIEHYKNQLEKAYQLCRRCEKVLKYTLLKEKAYLIANRVKSIQQNGLNLLDLTKATNGISAQEKQIFIVRLSKIIQGILAVSIMIHVNVSKLNNIEGKLTNVFDPYIEVIQELFTIFLNIFKSFFYKQTFLQVSQNAQNEKLLYLSITGFILEVVIFFFDKNPFTNRLNIFLCWSFLVMVSFIPLEEFSLLVYIYQILCSSLILYSLFKNPNVTKRLFHKMKIPPFENREVRSDDMMDNYSDEEFDDFASLKSGTLRKNSEDLSNSFKTFNCNSTFNRSFDSLYSDAKCKSVHDNFTADNLNTSFKSRKNGSFINSTLNTDRLSQFNVFSNPIKTVTPQPIKFTLSPSVLSLSPSPNNSGQSTCNRWSSSTFNNSLNVTFPNVNHSQNLWKTNLSDKIQNNSLFTSKCHSPNMASGQLDATFESASPSKKSWVAGGFWTTDDPITQLPQLSRTSSQESGFVSNNLDPFTSNPSSKRNSLCGEFDKCSIQGKFKPLSTKSNNFEKRRLFN